MNKKNWIQLAIVVVAFAGMFFVLYQGGIFGGGGGSSAPAAAAPAAAATAQILPYGSILQTPKDFNTVILPNRFVYNLITYPVVNTSTDVGISPVENLFPPQPPTPSP